MGTKPDLKPFTAHQLSISLSLSLSLCVLLLYFSCADFASPHSICGEAFTDHHRLSSGHPVSQLQGGSFCGTERTRLPRHLQLTVASSTAWWVSLCLSVLRSALSSRLFCPLLFLLPFTINLVDNAHT